MNGRVKIVIDSNAVEAQAGQTILQAARAAGIDIPTLCHIDGIEPRTSCFLCAVEVEGRADLVPACAARVEDGMAVRANSPEVVAARRMALELLFSDHAGCCEGPCAMACPAHVDVPGFIAAMAGTGASPKSHGSDGSDESGAQTRPRTAAGARAAVAILKRSIPFPATLGRICPAWCERPCVRGQVEEAVSIRLLHRHAGEADLASSDPWTPQCKPASGKRVAIVGAGPAGLTGAYYLAQQGHACVVFDAADRPGGLLRHDVHRDRLDDALVAAEIAQIERLGVTMRMGWRLGRDGSLDDLLRDHDAVLLALGAGVEAGTDQRKADSAFIKGLGLEAGARGIRVEAGTQETSRPGVFAAGEMTGGASYTVRCVAAARAAADAIDAFVRGQTVKAPTRIFQYWNGRATADEIIAARALAEKRNRALTDETFASASALHSSCPSVSSGRIDVAAAEAARCLQCGCEKREACALRQQAAAHDINPHRFKGERRTLEPDATHAEIVYEPGKCILCGLCLKIAEAAGEERGLSFAGRGFPTRVVVPLGGAMSEGLRRAAAQVAAACPTAAFHAKAVGATAPPATDAPGTTRD